MRSQENMTSFSKSHGAVLLETSPEARIAELQAKLQKLERRDWWLWMMAVVVMLLLTLAILSMNFPGAFRNEDPFFRFNRDQAVRGLVALILLFNTYTIYQQVIVKRLRKDFSAQLDAMRVLQVRANEFQLQATQDPLTGLFNRRFAEERLAAEASRSERYGHALALIAIDLDNFKQINDNHGHLAGDCVLKEFGARINSAVRRADTAARMGGDEFLILLPECPGGHVEAMLSRLALPEVEFEGKCIAVQFSAGWVAYEHGQTPAQLLERVDQALYARKRAGKPGFKQPALAS